MPKDYMMRPKRQVPEKANIRKFVSITSVTDDDGEHLVLRRYKEKEKVGEAILQDCKLPEEARRLVEEFRTL